MTIREEQLKAYWEYDWYFRIDFEDDMICRVYDWVRKWDINLESDNRKLNII